MVTLQRHKPQITTLGTLSWGNVPNDALAYVLFRASLLKKAPTTMAPSPLVYPFLSRYSASKNRMQLNALVFRGRAAKMRFIFSPWQKSSRYSDSTGFNAKAEGIADNGPIVSILISRSQGFQNSHVIVGIDSDRSACTSRGIATVTLRFSNGRVMRACASSIISQHFHSLSGKELGPFFLFQSFRILFSVLLDTPTPLVMVLSNSATSFSCSERGNGPQFIYQHMVRR
jgi:hypothetical protein